MPLRPIEFTEEQRRDIVRRYPGESMATIGRSYFASIEAVRRVLVEAGVEIRRPGGQSRPLPREDIEKMDWLYHGLGWTIEEVAAEFGVICDTMRSRFARSGIPIRTRAEANRKKWEKVPPEERTARGRRIWESLSPEKQQEIVERLASYSHSRRRVLADAE